MTINTSALTNALRGAIAPHSKDQIHTELALIKVLLQVKPLVTALQDSTFLPPELEVFQVHEVNEFNGAALTIVN